MSIQCFRRLGVTNIYFKQRRFNFNFSDYNIHLYSDSSYLVEYLLAGDSIYINTRGTFTLNDSHTEFSYENSEINTNDGNGWTPAIVTNTYSVNSLTYETLNLSLISSSDPNLSSVEVIMSKI